MGKVDDALRVKVGLAEMLKGGVIMDVTNADQASSFQLLEAARAVSHDIAISTDVMVGFPGETDEEFTSSIATVGSLGFSKLHVFRYSRREGTRAAAMPGQVPGPVAADRSARMHDLGERLASEYHHRFVGGRLNVLWEDAEKIGDQRRWSGLTGNYIRVLTEAPAGTDLDCVADAVDAEDGALTSSHLHLGRWE